MSGYAYREPRIGEKFTGWIDAVAAAKKIRADIKTAKQHGVIPNDVKVSVRSDRFAGGQSVDVRLSGWNPEAVWYEDEIHGYLKTTAAKQVEIAVEAIRSAYNRDASDSMVDYFDVTYYGVTEWDVYPWSAS